jgi:hypothetical protein
MVQTETNGKQDLQEVICKCDNGLQRAQTPVCHAEYHENNNVDDGLNDKIEDKKLQARTRSG